MEVVAFILERSVVVGLSLSRDRTKRCSHSECARVGRVGHPDPGGRDGSMDRWIVESRWGCLTRPVRVG